MAGPAETGHEEDLWKQNNSFLCADRCGLAHFIALRLPLPVKRRETRVRNRALLRHEVRSINGGERSKVHADREISAASREI